MQVIVEDRNDNKPVFQNTDFSTSISEVTSALMGVCRMPKFQRLFSEWEGPETASKRSRIRKNLLEGVASGTKFRGMEPHEQ